MKTRTHFHHKILSFNGEVDPTNGRVADGASIVVIGFTTEKKAIERARQIVTRENYRLEAAWECNEPDTEELKSEYLHMIRQMNKYITSELPEDEE